VHPELAANQGLSQEMHDLIPSGRSYRSIVALENPSLATDATIKIFLHLSQESTKATAARLTIAKVLESLSSRGYSGKKYWKDYQKAYERPALGATSTRLAPWYVVPADDK